MQSSSGPAANQEWAATPTPTPDEINPWLDHARQFSYVRAHISAFAAGSVVLLGLNLLMQSPDIWADSWITAWGLIVVMHVVIASIATLTVQLMAEDDDIRPASEVNWRPVNPAATWQAPKPEPPAEPEAPVDAWQAASAPKEPASTEEGERVSWQAAADAAWLNRSGGVDDDSDTGETGTDDAGKPGTPA